MQQVKTRLSGNSYEAIYRRFQWSMPAVLNIGALCSDVHPRRRTAMVYLGDTASRTVTFGEVSRASDRLATALSGIGLRPGDRIGVCLPQSLDTALAHLGAYKAGLVACPLSPLFGSDALQHRITDGGIRLLVTDEAGLERVQALADSCPDLEWILVVGEGLQAGRGRPRLLSFDEFIAGASVVPATRETGPDDPCLLIYTSGTTGPPKGVLHGHRVLPGQAPGFRLGHGFAPRSGDLFWTPSDWSWIAGLANILLAWMHGMPVVATSRRGFDPEWASRLMSEHNIRNVFLPTTALRMLLDSKPPRDVRLRSIVCGGEFQEPELLDDCRSQLGVTFSEVYGLTEADYMVGNCASHWPVRAGSTGREYPGHRVRVMDGDGGLCEAGRPGEIVIGSPDPSLFLGYWRQPAATEEKLRDGWFHTGDIGHVDEEGYLWFHARSDDVIKSSGYRIGPAEVEECLLKHPAVEQVAVVGAPDRLRGQIVMAYIILRDGQRASSGLEAELQELVRRRLAAYQYPRAFSFVDELPSTVSGKVDRAELRRRATRAAVEAEGAVGW